MDTNDLSIGTILEVYLPNVPQEHRDAVVGSLMKAKLIQDAFNDPRGKMILEAAVNMITAKIQEILELCRKSFEGDMPRFQYIERVATEINIIESFLHQWAGIYSPLPTAKDDVAKKIARRKKVD